MALNGWTRTCCEFCLGRNVTSLLISLTHNMSLALSSLFTCRCIDVLISWCASAGSAVEQDYCHAKTGLLRTFFEPRSRKADGIASAGP
jgi:hypothetical protein